MRVFFFLSILVLSFMVPLTGIGQKVFIVAVESGRSFSRVELNQKYLGTIEGGEHLQGHLVKGVNRLKIDQRGYDSLEHLVENTNEDIVVEIKTTSRKIQVTNKVVRGSKYAHLFQSGLSAGSNDQRGGLTDNVSGELPSPRTTMMAHYNEPSSQCTNYGYVANLVTVSFMKKFQLIDRSLVETVLDEQRLSLSGLVSQSTLIEAGNITGASHVLDASIQCLGPERVNLQISIIHCETSKIVWVVSYRDIEVDEVPDILSEAISR